MAGMKQPRMLRRIEQGQWHQLLLLADQLA